jgi:hypothetical protein
VFEDLQLDVAKGVGTADQPLRATGVSTLSSTQSLGSTFLQLDGDVALVREGLVSRGGAGLSLKVTGALTGPEQPGSLG